MFPEGAKLQLSVIAFQICMTCNRRTSTVWPEKHLKTACLGGKVSGLSDFGRSCMPNYWHQVNFQATPEFWTCPILKMPIVTTVTTFHLVCALTRAPSESLDCGLLAVEGARHSAPSLVLMKLRAPWRIFCKQHTQSFNSNQRKTSLSCEDKKLAK